MGLEYRVNSLFESSWNVLHNNVWLPRGKYVSRGDYALLTKIIVANKERCHIPIEKVYSNRTMDYAPLGKVMEKCLLDYDMQENGWMRRVNLVSAYTCCDCVCLVYNKGASTSKCHLKACTNKTNEKLLFLD